MRGGGGGLRGPADLRAAADEHRREIAECEGVIRACGPGWGEPARPGGWTRAEIAEHLALAYDPVLSELSGGPGFQVRLPWWKRAPLRWAVMPRILRGGFPHGAPAPRETRPNSVRGNPEEAARRLSEQAERFLARLAEECAARRVRVTHAYFGRLPARDAVKLLTAHARHHRRQLSG